MILCQHRRRQTFTDARESSCRSGNRCNCNC